MKTTRPTPDFLHRAYERARKMLLVWSSAAVLTASAMTGAGRLGWFAHGEIWALIPAALSAALLGWWLKRTNQLTRAKFAQKLDAQWELRSRLESAVELSADPSALAAAQRTEAMQKLAGHEDVGLAPWLAGLALIALGLGLLGVEGTIFAFRALRAQTPAVAMAAKTPPAAPPEIRATIEWKTPEREIKATAIEEVPLTAVADSTGGFRAVTLEVAVNGEHKLSRPLDATALGQSAQSGAYELTPSLFIDETGAKPFDIISYHLVGELNGSTPARVVTSPLQFVQIRPPQRDVERKGEANPDASRLLSMLSSLKLAQLRLIEANFTLSHMADAKDDPTWQTENSRVATDQKDLAKKVDEARDFATEKNAPKLIPKNLDEARSFVLEAAKDIAARNNEGASKPQGRALALITECEKLFGQALEMTGPPPPPLPMEDPFHDDQIFKLQPREETPAGQLEKLVARQREASQQLGSAASGQGPGSGSGDTVEKEIARDADKLASSGQLDTAAQTLTQDAATAAATAARQLGANDPQAAREPAGTALAALEKAAEAQDRAGRGIAVDALVRARRALNAASRNDNSGDRGGKLLAVRDELRAAATRQQRTGSAEAARQLATVAELLGASKIPGSASKPNSTDRAHEVAIAAARGQIALTPRAAALNRVIRQLNRGRSTAGSPGPAPETLGDLEIAGQEAEWLTSDTPTIALAQSVGTQAGVLQRSPPSSNQAALRETGDAATRLAAALETARMLGKRDEIVRRFNIEDIDPAYREAVETYFERLSREGAKERPPATKP